ncbi:MAG: pyruvate dehydrogenase (acetyl-transferring) E1 component subunit alpha [Gammaproteobacteria bacterium]|nr:pyruvate dehydrogenase (acetyl-transferring) E1 component subunit alpha [Gammaproteobacteria bacterium]
MQGIDITIEITELLDSTGKLQGELPGALNGRDQLVELYRTMVLTRLFDGATINLQRTGAMGTYPSNEGQEAIGVGVGRAMRADDVLVPYYRDVALQILRGTLLEEILLYWGGDERGMCFQNQAEDFPISVPIASQCCHAVGVAYAMKYRGEKRAVVTTLGDGGTSQGDFYESINVAGVMKLPVVFVVNNNRWAISVPLEKQTAAPSIAHKAIAAGIDGVRVDGNDPIAVYQVVDQALQTARDQQQPCIVEALSYRLCDHTTADDASRYRDQQEYQQARKLEPLIRFKRYLQSAHQWSDADDQSLYDDCDKQVKQAIEAYRSKPDQATGEFFDYMFAAPTHDLKKQKQEFLAEEKKHG